jgi:hypothetical protein
LIGFVDWKKFRALSASFRRNSNPVPCHAFAPLFVVRLMTPPLNRPSRHS